MIKMTVKNAAKINLVLDVTGKLSNGYHTIESIFQTVGIYDEITAELTDKGISVTCEIPERFAQSDEIPCGERNIAYKAAKLFLEKNGLVCGCNIHIKKGIPSQAGMGGGSSDAAAVLYMLNKLTGANMTAEGLTLLGAQLGADVPFFLTGGTAYVTGIGEKITQTADYSGKLLVIAKGADGVSTAEAYKNIDGLTDPVHPRTDKAVNAINSGADAHIYFGNLFESAVRLESVDRIKEIMIKNDALTAVMTGSGSAVFGLFSDIDTARSCAVKLAENEFYAEICKTVGKSFIEV